jgi:serine O-acetyltransferase
MRAKGTTRLDEITDGLLASYNAVGSINHIGGPPLPSRQRTIEIWQTLRALLFPGFFEVEQPDRQGLMDLTRERVAWVRRSLSEEVRHSFCHQCTSYGECDSERKTECGERARRITDSLLLELPVIRAQLHMDARAALEGDPAAKCEEEVILAYPGLAAVTVHRVAHFLYQNEVPLLPRIMSEHIHHQTGIDIHPGATIGESFFIDHGTGVVIGETTMIGANVKIYQGVTVGALSVKKSMACKKRHPTIEDNVTIYAGATILGGETVIGKDSIIGGNVWLVRSVPPFSRVYNSAASSQPIIVPGDNGSYSFHI